MRVHILGEARFKVRVPHRVSRIAQASQMLIAKPMPRQHLQSVPGLTSTNSRFSPDLAYQPRDGASCWVPDSIYFWHLQPGLSFQILLILACSAQQLTDQKGIPFVCHEASGAWLSARGSPGILGSVWGLHDRICAPVVLILRTLYDLPIVCACSSD